MFFFISWEQVWSAGNSCPQPLHISVFWYSVLNNRKICFSLYMLDGILLSGGQSNWSIASSISVEEYGKWAEPENSIIAQYVAHMEMFAPSEWFTEIIRKKWFWIRLGWIEPPFFYIIAAVFITQFAARPETVNVISNRCKIISISKRFMVISTWNRFTTSRNMYLICCCWWTGLLRPAWTSKRA